MPKPKIHVLETKSKRNHKVFLVLKDIAPDVLDENLTIHYVNENSPDGMIDMILLSDSKIMRAFYIDADDAVIWILMPYNEITPPAELSGYFEDRWGMGNKLLRFLRNMAVGEFEDDENNDVYRIVHNS